MNTKITLEANKKTMPTIKSGSKIKTASQVRIEDIEIISSNSALVSTIKEVKPSTTSDGTTVVVTIQVASSVVGTTSKTYQVELGGFTSLVDHVVAKITIEINKKTMPRIKSGSEIKTASQVRVEDIEIISSDPTLISEVLGVRPSTITKDGTTIIVFIFVHTDIDTGPTIYEVELTGFAFSPDFIYNKILTETSKETPPTIKSGSKIKTAYEVKIEDIEIASSDPTLISRVFWVRRSTITDDGTTVEMAILVEPNFDYNPIQVYEGIYQIELGGFTSLIKRVNAKIIVEADKKIPPTIKSGSETKTAWDVKIEDIEIVQSIDSTLILRVSNVKPSDTTNDGTTVTVTILVTSIFKDINSKFYKFELGGFVALPPS